MAVQKFDGKRFDSFWSWWPDDDSSDLSEAVSVAFVLSDGCSSQLHV